MLHDPPFRIHPRRGQNISPILPKEALFFHHFSSFPAAADYSSAFAEIPAAVCTMMPRFYPYFFVNLLSFQIFFLFIMQKRKIQIYS
ncbi:hypothetical protein [Dysosmobacter sp.]|uniref:hypothetical protein n=1 Tax=Dysosmobacter sp. TaxID=2591382 RepID=UPI003FD7F2B8